MAVRVELCQDSVPDQENTDGLQDSYEAEETLSLCDLPIYSDASNWVDDYSKEDQSLSDHDDNDFFEFLSEDFAASTCATTVNKNIIFCGKIIPCKDLPEPEKTQKQESTTNTKLRNEAKTGFLRWKSLSFNKTRSSSKYSKLPEDKDSKTLALPSSKGYVYGTSNCDFSVGKVSMLASSSTKSRWYLFMFGMTRFPTEMELRDMKIRQSRRMRSQSSMARSVECDEMIKRKQDGSRGKGLWRLLRVLGCGCRSRHSNAVVKASFDCIPHV